MLSIEVFERIDADEPARSLGVFKFAAVPRIGDILTGCTESKDIPSDPLRVIEVVHKAVPEERRFDNEELANVFGSPTVLVIGHPVLG